MARELVVLVVAAAFCALVVWAGALGAHRVRLTSRDREQAAWWRLMLPLFAAAFVVAFLTGWALQEPPQADEKAGTALHVAALFPLAIASRAFARGVRAR